MKRLESTEMEINRKRREKQEKRSMKAALRAALRKPTAKIAEFGKPAKVSDSFYFQNVVCAFLFPQLAKSFICIFDVKLCFIFLVLCFFL